MNPLLTRLVYRKICAIATFAALSGLMAPSASAGQGCDDTQLTVNTFTRAMTTAQHVAAEIDKLPVNVVLLGRMGQDLSEYGLRYSHVGFAYRERAGAPWRITHLLNECGTAKSDLWYEGLGNFFLDDMFRFDTLLLVPPPKVANALLPKLQQGQLLRAVFQPHYNTVAFPFSTRYQNSNGWVLETLTQAEAKDTTIGNREQAQAWLKMAGYKPSTMEIGGFKRLGGRMFRANVAFDDHPDAMRLANHIDVVTVDSIQDFLLARHEGWTVREIPAPH